MKTKTLFTKSVNELDFLLQETIQKEFKPTLAVVFASLKCDITKVQAQFSKHDIEILGSSTAGEIGDNEVQSEGISVLLMDIDKAHFQIVQKKSDYKSSDKIGEKIAEAALERFTNPAFIMVFSLGINGEELINGISNKVNGYPSIFGGMAGDDLQMKDSTTFTNTTKGTNLVTVLVLDNDKIAVKGMALCGWQPVGIEHKITRASDNVIYEINNEPALTVVKRYFGDYFENSKDSGAVPLGAAQYPLQIIKEDNSYVLRAALSANMEDGSLNMAGPIKEGDRFHFSVAPGFEIIDETIEGFKEFHTKNQEVDCLLMFSCVARHMSLGPLIEDEIEGVYDIWKKPMVGFFTYGEVGQQGNGDSHYYNETCSLVLLKEQ